MTRTITTIAILAFLALAAASAVAFECGDYNDVLQPLGQLTIAQADPTEMHVVGDAAYSIGENDPFVAVYDLTDPLQPLEMAPLLLPAAPTGLAASADWLLVTVPDLGLVRYDLADPLAPVVDDTLDLGMPLPDVTLDGSVAVVSIGDGIRVVLLDEPAGMVARGIYATSSAVNGVALDGFRLYMATSDDDLIVLDVENPMSLRLVGTASYPRAADRVAVGEGLAVLTGRGPNFLGWTAVAYDITVDTPLVLSSVDVRLGGYDHVVPTITGPDRVVIASRSAGLHEFAVTPEEFVPMGFLPGKHADFQQDAARYLILSGSQLSTAVPGPLPPAPIVVDGAGQQRFEDDDYVFSTFSHRLSVVQMDAPFGPARIGSRTLSNPGTSRQAMALEGWALYVGDTNSRIDIVSVYNLRGPVHAAYRTLPADPTAMIAEDGVLYVLMAGWGMATYDLSDPLDPQLITTFDLEIDADRGAVKLGNQLLVGTNFNGVDVFDVTDPSSVSLVDNLPGRNYISDLALAGDRLLVTDRVQTTQVWQREAGTDAWALLGTVDASRILDAAVGGDVAYLRHEFGDVLMLDLRGPGVPEIVATLPTGFTDDGGIVAGDDWVSVRLGSDHRIFPAPCLPDVTAAPGLPAVPALNLTAAPNPFNPQTRLSFALDRPGEVRLRVYDLRGRLVDTLIDGPLGAGHHHVDWNGTDQIGRSLPSGVYLTQLTAGNQAISRKLMLLE